MKTVSSEIQCTATLIELGGSTILRIPEEASKQLPSRGQVAVVGTINGIDFQTVLEPDGYWGHWMRIDKSMQQKASVRIGDSATLVLKVTKEWPEPEIPQDIAAALQSAPEKVLHKWQDITPMARWEWIRWVNSTANSDTRTIRIEKTISKLNGKHRRPCCFNLAACTDPDLSKSGRLMESTAL